MNLKMEKCTNLKTLAKEIKKSHFNKHQTQQFISQMKYIKTDFSAVIFSDYIKIILDGT